jgi:hypothetical protein
LSPILFNFYSKQLTNRAVEGCGDFRTGGKAILTVKYAAEEETVLQGMTDGLILEDAAEWK